MPAARTAVKTVGTVRRPRAGRIETWDGSVLDGMTVRACQVYAPRAARPWMLGEPDWMSASGRRPSTETMTTWRGAGVGVETGTVGAAGEPLPQPARRKRRR